VALIALEVHETLCAEADPRHYLHMDHAYAHAAQVTRLRRFWNLMLARPDLSDDLEAMAGSGHVEAFAAWDRLVAHGRLLDRSLLF